MPRVKMPTKIATTVFGSYGTLDVAADGTIIRGHPGADAAAGTWEYADILRFDIAEHIREYGWLDTDTDIADIGYWAWTRKGKKREEYYAADAGFRKEFRYPHRKFYRRPDGSTPCTTG